MRRRLRYVCIFMLVLGSGCVGMPAGVADLSSAPTAETATYVHAMRLPVAYREIGVPPVPFPARLTLTPAQAKEDIESLQYLFDTAYSGRDYWGMRGVDFSAMYRALDSFADESVAAGSDRPLTNWDLENRIAALLTPIVDNHLGITGRSPHFPRRHNTAYFADILIEKTRAGFIVVDSGVGEVAIGAAYTGPAVFLFPTLSPAGREQFLAGTLSFAKTERLALSFNGAGVSVSVHTCRIGRMAYRDEREFTEENLDGVPLLHVSSFEGRVPEAMGRFIEAGAAQRIRQSNQFVLDLRENCGGARLYAQRFLSNVYQAPPFEVREIRQFSPAIVAATLADREFNSVAGFSRSDESPAAFRRLQEKYRQTPLIERALFGQEPETGAVYRGKIVVLINRRTSSAAEIATSFARAGANNVVIGENSSGTMAFGNVRYYQLKHSGITLSLPSSIVIMPGFKETEGFRPDYWLDTETPEPEVVRWLHDPAHYQFRVRQPDALVGKTGKNATADGKWQN